MARKSFEFVFALAASINSSFNASFSTATTKIKSLKSSVEELNSVQSGINNAFSKGIINQKSFDNAQKQINIMNKSMQKAATTEMFQKSFIDATAFYYGAKNIAAFLATPVQAAMKFESAMADVKKVVDFDTPQQFKEMGNDILNLSKRIPMSAEGLAQIVASGGQAGIAKNELIGFAESAAKMGVAFDITADQAGDMMAKWRTAFKMNQTQVVELADKINFLGNTTAASAPLISDVVTRIGPLGSVGGVASGEIAALGASLVGSGIQSDVAATGIKNMILTMTAGVSATKAQSKAFDQLGLDAQTMAVKMQKDSKSAILEMLHSIKSLDKVQQSQVMSDLFGERAIAAIAPLLSNLDALQENFDKVGQSSNYAGSMNQEYERVADTTGNSVKLMQQRIEAANVKIGEGLLPVVATVTEYLGGMASTIGDVAGKYPELTNKTVEFGGALLFAVGLWHLWNLASNGARALNAAYNLALESQTIAHLKNVAAMGKGIVMQKTYAAATKLATLAQQAFNLALAAPWGWILVIIATVVVAGTILYKHWDKIKTFFTELWESPTARMMMFVTGPIGWLVAAVSSIITNWDTIKSYFEYFWDNPEAAIFRFTSYVKEQLKSAADWVENKWNSIKEFLSTPIFGSVNVTASGNGRATRASIAQNAAGGIYGKGAFLTTFAEHSGESAIPHTPTRRNIDLLAQTNRIMGNPIGGSSINATFAPNITVNGGTTVEDVRSVMDDEMRKFEAMLRRVAEQQRRVSYG